MIRVVCRGGTHPPADEGWRYSIVPLCPLRRPRHCFPQSSRGLSFSLSVLGALLSSVTLTLTPLHSCSLLLHLSLLLFLQQLRRCAASLVLSSAERSGAKCMRVRLAAVSVPSSRGAISTSASLTRSLRGCSARPWPHRARTCTLPRSASAQDESATPWQVTPTDCRGGGGGGVRRRRRAR